MGMSWGTSVGGNWMSDRGLREGWAGAWYSHGFFRTPEVRKNLQNWLKATKLLGRVSPGALEVLKQYDFDLATAFNAYHEALDNETGGMFETVGRDAEAGKWWNGTLANFAPFIGAIVADFIEKRLGYASTSEEFARIFVRIGEAVDVAQSLLASIASEHLRDPAQVAKVARDTNRTQTTFPNHPYKYAYPWGIWWSYTINKKNDGGVDAQGGVDFKNCFGYPENSEKPLELIGFRGDGARKKGKKGDILGALKVLVLCLWSLSVLIADADLPENLNVRQRRAILVEKLSTYLPGMVELDDGRTMYCLADTPPGKRSTLDLDVAPEGRDPGYIPGVKLATGWFKGMEFLVEDSLLPYTQRAVRYDLREAAPKQGVTTDTRRTAALAKLAAESAAVNAATAAAMAAKAAVEAQRRELDARRAAAAKAESGVATTTSTTSTTSTGDTGGSGGSGGSSSGSGGSGGKGKLLLGVAAAAAGIYFMNKG